MSYAQPYKQLQAWVQAQARIITERGDVDAVVYSDMDAVAVVRTDTNADTVMSADTNTGMVAVVNTDTNAGTVMRGIQIQAQMLL